MNKTKNKRCSNPRTQVRLADAKKALPFWVDKSCLLLESTLECVYRFPYLFRADSASGGVFMKQIVSMFDWPALRPNHIKRSFSETAAVGLPRQLRGGGEVRGDA